MEQWNYQGLWPVMITPFTNDGEIDYGALERLIAWYEEHGAAGLFAACQSSEIFFLSPEERKALQDRISELTEMRRAGADALIMITNRLCTSGNVGGSVIPVLEQMVKQLPQDVPLGFNECPYPTKRLLTLDELKWCAESGRFAFMKDTCCDIDLIRQRIDAISGSSLHLFNANTATLLDSLIAGGAGFSGVMMNFHMDLYDWLWRNWQSQPEKARHVQDFLTVFSEIERQYYPVNAKYHLCKVERLLDTYETRTKPADGLIPVFQDEVQQLHRCARVVYDMYCR